MKNETPIIKTAYFLQRTTYPKSVTNIAKPSFKDRGLKKQITGSN